MLSIGPMPHSRLFPKCGAAAGVLDDATDGALWDEWDEVDAFSDDARDGDGDGDGGTERDGGVAFPWGRARFRGAAPGCVLPGTPNKLLFHRE